MIRKKWMGILLSAVLAITSIPVSAQDTGREPVVGLELVKEQNETRENSAEEVKEPESQKDTEQTSTEQVTEAQTETVKETERQTESSEETESQTEAESEKPKESKTESSENLPETEQMAEEKSESESESEKETQEEEDLAVQALKALRAASGNSDAGGSSVVENARFVPGTYTVTANLYVPGELNSILGINAYLTNPNNPSGIVEDGSAVSNTAPTTPMTANASITIGEDGVTKTLTIPVKNPVFTLQKIGGGENVTIIDSSRNSNTYGDYTGRITSLTVTLEDNSGAYVFHNCLEYPTLLDQDWTVPLYLAVDLASIPGDSSVKVASGDGSIWQMGSADSLAFILDEVFERMEGVQVDGADLADQNYSAFAYNGMTYVDLNVEYLSSLSNGSHNITVLFADGFSANASFTVKKEETTDETANEQAGKNLLSGTYQVTANLYLPGELNTQLPGTTAYLTNPNNPLGIGGHNGIPLEPVTENATLVVGKNGAKTVIVDVVNPVFTLQKISSGKNISVKAAVRDKEVYTGVSQTASRTGRITKLYLELKDNKGIYQFGECTEFPTLLETDWNVPLQLSVEFQTVKKLSDSTKVEIPAEAEKGNTGTESEKTTEKQTETETDKKTQKDTDPNAGDGTLKPGTYTVAANIWIDKASSGLPLNPHLTSSVFPPKDPVSNNAKVTIDKNGEATVKVPIVIPSKVMSVKSISGLNIVDSSSSGGYLTSITVDLGKVTNPNAVITKSCTVSLDLGELAQTIAKKGKEQTWGATFQVNFSGIPSGGSGGGNVDVNALMAQAETNASDTSATNIRIGIRADAYSAPYIPMMEAHKNDTEIKEKKSDTDKQTSANGALQSSTATVTTEVKNSYLFTIEELAETEANKDLTDEEQAEALSKQYLQHFTDGTYDLILVTPEEAETLYKELSMKGKFVVLTMLEYQKRGADTQKDAAGEDAAQEESKAQEVRLLLATTAFVRNHAQAVGDILEKTKASVAEANANPEQTAVSMVTFHMEGESTEASVLLKEYEAVLLTGEKLQNEMKALAEDQALSDLKEEGLCYTQAVKTANAEVQTTPEIESEENESKETEKITITDADSLSAALDAALEKKTQDAGDASDDVNASDDSNTASGTVTVSNSSGLDLEEEEVAGEALQPGTYTVSANLYLPGERNTQLPGTTAYMTNPDNPLGIGDHEGLPIVPAQANGTLVVAEDGTKTVTVDIVNPVFTLQKIDAPQNSQILEAVKDNERYEGTNGVGVDGRITQLVIQLGDNSALYPFDDCAEFPTLLETDWYVPLELSVEFTTAEKISDSTEVSLPESNF